MFVLQLASAQTYSERFHFQSNILCERAEKEETQKLRSILDAHLAKRCHDMPELFARLAGEYPTREDALDQVKKISDKAFVESANDELTLVRGTLHIALNK